MPVGRSISRIDGAVAGAEPTFDHSVNAFVAVDELRHAQVAGKAAEEPPARPKLFHA
jgi:hypothetical protein